MILVSAKRSDDPVFDEDSIAVESNQFSNSGIRRGGAVFLRWFIAAVAAFVLFDVV